MGGLSIADVFVQIGVQGLASVTAALNATKNYLSAIGAAAANAIDNLAGTGGVLGNLAKAMQGVMQLGMGLQMMFKGFVPLAQALIPIFYGVGKSIYKAFDFALIGVPTAWMGHYKQLALDTAQFVASVFSAAASKATLVFSAVKAAAVDLSSAFANTKIGEKIVTGLYAAKFLIQGLATDLRNLPGQIAQDFRRLGQIIASNIKSGVTVAFNWLDSRLGGSLSGIGAHFASTMNTIAINAKVAGAVIQQALPNAMQKLAPVIQGIITALNGLKNVVSGVGGAIGSVIGTAAVASANAFKMAANGAQKAINGIGTAAQYAGAAIQGLYLNAIPIFGGIFNFLRSGLTSVIGLARSLVSALMTPLRIVKDFIFSAQGMLVGLFGTLSAAAVGKYIVEVSSDAEQAAIAFEVMLGSAEKAKLMLAQIQELADKTTLQLPEVRQGARTLLAMNIAAKEVVPTLRMLGDVAQGLQIPLEDLSRIYGKIFQKNRITGDEIRQFGRRGIPVVRELAKQLGVSTEKIYEMASEGKLGFKELEKAFKAITGEGGEFHNMMARMADTVAGRFSNLQDAVRALAVQIGQAIAPALKQVINYFIELAEWAKKSIGPFKEQVAQFAQYVASQIPPMIAAIKSSLPAMLEVAKTSFAVIKAIGGIMGEIATRLTEAIGGTDKLASGFMRVVKEIRFVAEEWKTLIQLADAYFDNFGSVVGGAFKQIFSDVMVNLKHIGNFLWTLVRSIVEFVSNKFQILINNASKELWGGNFDNANRILEQSAQENVKSMQKALSKMFTQAPGFDLAKIAGFDNPQIKAVLDVLLGKRKIFWFKEAMQPVADLWQKVTDFFAQKKNVDLGGGIAEHERETKDKQKVSIESLTQFAQNIQQSVTPAQARRDQWAEATAKGITDIQQNGIKVKNLGPQGAAFA